MGPATATGLDRLAGAARGLGDESWHDQLVSWGARPADPATGAPTYERVALAGADAVVELVDALRWDEAFAVADRLTRLFRQYRHQLHPVAAESFDGLRAAVSARDREEVGDFIDLLAEMFGSGDG